jgi:hypothetical protein
MEDSSKMTVFSPSQAMQAAAQLAAAGNQMGMTAQVVDAAFKGMATGNTPFIHYDLGKGQSSVNPYFQASLTNTAMGHKQETLRVGSPLGEKGMYTLYNQAAGGQDSVSLVDQFGTYASAVQGFSRMTSLKPMLITEIRINSSDVTMLSNQVKYRTIGVDLSIKDENLNVLSTQEMWDQRTNLTIIKPQGHYGWILDANHFLEFTIVDNITVNLLFFVGLIDNIGQMVQPQ